MHGPNHPAKTRSGTAQAGVLLSYTVTLGAVPYIMLHFVFAPNPHTYSLRYTP